MNKSMDLRNGTFYLDYESKIFYSKSEEPCFSSTLRLKLNKKWISYNTSKDDNFAYFQNWSQDESKYLSFTELTETEIEIDLERLGNYLVIVSKNYRDKHYFCPISRFRNAKRYETKICIDDSEIFDVLDYEEFSIVEDNLNYVSKNKETEIYVSDDEKESSMDSEKVSDADDTDFLLGSMDMDFEIDMDDLAPKPFVQSGDPPLEIMVEETDWEAEKISVSDISKYSESDRAWVVSNSQSWGLGRIERRRKPGGTSSNFSKYIKVVTPFPIDDDEIPSINGKTLYQFIKDKIVEIGSEDVDFELNILQVMFRRYADAN